TVFCVAKRDHALDGRQAVPLRILCEVAIDLGGKIGAREVEPRGLDMKSAAVIGKRKHSGRSRPTLAMQTKRVFDRCDAFVEVDETFDLGPRQEKRLARPHTLAGDGTASKSSNRAMGRTSIGSDCRRKMRAPAFPFSVIDPPSTRSSAPSRSPTTGVSFSSRN